MKAVERAKLVRSLRQESRRLRLLVLVIGFFLVTLTFVVLSKPDALLFNLNGRLSVDEAPRSLLIRQATDAGADVSQGSAAAQDPKLLDDFEDAESNAKATTKEEEEERALASSDPQQSAKKEPESRLLGTLHGRGGPPTTMYMCDCCLPKPTGEQRRATRRAGRLPGLLVGPSPSGNGPQLPARTSW